jgi:hypothetical protein
VTASGSALRAAQAHIAFPSTATRQHHRTSHGGGLVDLSKMFPAVSARVTDGAACGDES